jgi:hypothetical protein
MALEFEALDVPSDGDVRLRALDDVVVTIPSGCLAQSQFLAALSFEDEDSRTLFVPTIPSLYLRFAALYLRAACDGYIAGQPLTTAQAELVTVRNVVYYPQLLQYCYGYLAIDSFRAFYQYMLLEVVERGTLNSNMTSHLEDATLDLLSEPQLYQVSQYQPQRVNALYRVANARHYLQLKLQRLTLALSGNSVLEVRGDQLWIAGHRVPNTGSVTSVHTRQHHYYYLDEGRIYTGRFQGGDALPARRIVSPYLLTSLSVGRRWLAGVTEDGEVYLQDLNTNPAFAPGRLAVQDVREVLVSPQAERLVLLLSGGRLAVYGDYQVREDSPLAALVRAAPVVPGWAVRQVPAPWPIRMVAPDESSLLTDQLRVVSDSGRVAISDTYGLGAFGVTFTARLDAVSQGTILERGVTAMAYDPLTRRLVFRAVNGALRYWRAAEDGSLVREYQRRR